jgi:phosphate acetyltransferase
MDIIKQYVDKIRGRQLRVVFPEGRDQRIIRAARQLADDDLAVPIILGTPEQITAAADQAGVDLDGISTLNPRDNDKLDEYAKAYIEGRDDLPLAVARRVVNKPAFCGGMMVACGHADAMVGGAASATATMIQSGTLTVGLMEGLKTASSYFLMVIPDFQGQKDKPFIYADCAVNIDPNAEELADIALASAKSAHGLLGEAPRVAMLSYSTHGSASGQSVEKIRKALEIARTRRPELAIDGEFQADSAIIPGVAAKKVKDQSDVAGKANVLIFPDLNAGNMAYKLTQYMANAQAIGPFLQGFAKPIADLSRGASVDDIVSTTILTLVQLI